jgi:chloramphenicol 3-O-phosphotransferase
VKWGENGEWDAIPARMCHAAVMLILINGTMNAGKTTVARILQRRIPRTAHVEKLLQFIAWMPLEEAIPLNIKNIVSLTRNFAEAGLNVVISYPVSMENFRRIEGALADLGQPIHAFTLAPPLEIAITNRGTRELAAWEVALIKQSYAEGYNNPGYGMVIDNSDQTPEETARIILEAVGVA